MPANKAVIPAVPGVTPVAIPGKPALLATVATEDGLAAQVAYCVRFWVLPSENVPTAVNGVATSTGMETLAGVTTIDVSGNWVTITVPLPCWP